MQNGQFRTSCRSRVIHQFWKRFALYIATAGLAKFIFKSSISDEVAPRKWCKSIQKIQKYQKRDDSRDLDKRLRDLAEWLEEFTDNLEDTEFPAPRLKWFFFHPSFRCVSI